ncbi:hypothetical protein OGR47_01780 [Methylocystis sp. MJC1]|uniref:hypothetical protein n=1 Tax=Methylocystis sp. MJC1 TaxID=2654282 RepID=UPI0019D27781|nr:hypothetical protein [Methylocystis sp. MJC1]KAF2990598.1 hypothetical protein MJC1_02360 [Methylocystis sp. MJC1]MBU6525741.1 hypothetical protein [Methylocystis sp. MJC1]UZX12210.1 hypothetical protein OGR47_01780 [Methylocystis sp. MJC1]
MSATITVTRADERFAFDVSVSDAKRETRHRVTLSQGDFERLGAGVTAEEFIEAAFRFLLDREPKEAILSRFDVSVISRYFPEFEKEIHAYLLSG